MTIKEFIAIEKQIVPDMPGFTFKRSLMFSSPVGPLLRGLNFEPSSFDKKSFYLTAFVMPLCVPTKHLHFNFGKRVRHVNGIDGWNADELDLIGGLRDALKVRAIPFLSGVNSLLDFVEVAKTFSLGNPHTRRAIAFALARAGGVDQATDVIDELLNQVDRRVPWQLEIANQSTDLKDKILKDPRETEVQLAACESETIRNLGLEEFANCGLTFRTPGRKGRGPSPRPFPTATSTYIPCWLDFDSTCSLFSTLKAPKSWLAFIPATCLSNVLSTEP